MNFIYIILSHIHFYFRRLSRDVKLTEAYPCRSVGAFTHKVGNSIHTLVCTETKSTGGGDKDPFVTQSSRAALI